MKYYREISLKYFEFWGGAKDTIKYLSTEDLNKIEEYLDELLGELKIIWSETQINDYFWFEEDEIAKILGYEKFDHLIEKKKNIPWA